MRPDYEFYASKHDIKLIRTMFRDPFELEWTNMQDFLDNKIPKWKPILPKLKWTNMQDFLDNKTPKLKPILPKYVKPETKWPDFYARSMHHQKS